MKEFFYDLDYAAILEWTESEGLPKFRAEQIYQWQKEGIQNADEMTNLSKALRAKINQAFSFAVPELLDCLTSKADETQKFLFRLSDGPLLEAVLMKYHYGLSLCLSTQAGCRMGCLFCASTVASFERNLSAGEMLWQVAQIQRVAKEPIKRIVLMGIGEPLENLKNVLSFLERVHDPRLFDLSYRRITLSTCGLVPQILALAEVKKPVTLSISLHAAEQKKREKIMPIAKTFPLEQLMVAADQFFAKTGRRVSFEYILLRDTTDTKDDLDALISLMKGRKTHVNLIPANHYPGSPFEAPLPERVQAFYEGLKRAGVETTVRRSLGQDIAAACGQLRLRHLAKQGGQC